MLKKIDYDKFNNFYYERIFNNIDRKPLKNSRNKREFVIKGEDEKNLLNAITKYSNPELRQIILLSLYTVTLHQYFRPFKSRIFDYINAILEGTRHEEIEIYRRANCICT